MADVAIDGGRITAIGQGLSGDRDLDADGHVVAPGFIDIHTHYDAQVFWDPCADARPASTASRRSSPATAGSRSPRPGPSTTA